MCKCFPGNVISKLNSRAYWVKDRVMPIRTWFELRQRITDGAEEFDWRQVHKAAEDFDLPVDQVCAILRSSKISSADNLVNASSFTHLLTPVVVQSRGCKYIICHQHCFRFSQEILGNQLARVEIL